MHTEELIKRIRYCPLCGVLLELNPFYWKAGAMSCSEHGDFFVQRWNDRDPELIFRPLDSRRHTRWFRRDRSQGRVQCLETGAIFSTQTAACKAMGINKSNLSKHLLRKPGALSVKGYTFQFVE